MLLNKNKDEKKPIKNEIINKIGKLFPSEIKKEKLSHNIDEIHKISEIEIWRSLDYKNKNNNLILTEYLIKTEKEEDNPLKNRKVINNTKEKINIIENYFSKAQLNRNMENIEYENESDNSDKETERKITIFRNSEIDEDDEEEDRFSEENINKTRSKKVINKKILEGEHKTAEYPEFYAECKFYGEGKERYHVKIIIDSSFNLNFSPEMKKGFKSYSLYYYQFPLLSIKNYIVTRKNKKYVIDLILKDYRSFSFKLTAEDYLKFNEIIQEFGKPSDNSKYFRFAHFYYNI